MSEAIVTALITGGLSLVGVVITSLVTARRSENALRISQAVTDTKIDELTREVREHNGFARRMPVLEEQIRETASVFAMDMLLLKFIQGLPVVGLLGGAANPLYYHRILHYTQLKYKRRYLLNCQKQM